MKCLFSSLIFPTVSALEAKHFRGGGKKFAAKRLAGCLAIPFRHSSSIRHWVNVNTKLKIRKFREFHLLTRFYRRLSDSTSSPVTSELSATWRISRITTISSIWANFPAFQRFRFSLTVGVETFVAADCVISCANPHSQSSSRYLVTGKPFYQNEEQTEESVGFLDGNNLQIGSPARSSPHSQGSDNGERFSRKVFVGGLPPDIDEGESSARFEFPSVFSENSTVRSPDCLLDVPTSSKSLPFWISATMTCETLSLSNACHNRVN